MIKTRINNEYKDVVKIFGGGTLQKEIIKVWSREAQEYVYESSVEYTGTLPIAINANGDTLLDYRIYGADVGVGEQTENLIDANKPNVQQRVEVEPGEKYCLSKYEQRESYGRPQYAIYDENDNLLMTDYIGVWMATSFTIPANGKYALITFGTNYAGLVSFAKGTSPNTATPYPENYIPYGYKLPMVVHSELKDIGDTVSVNGALWDIVDYNNDFTRATLLRHETLPFMVYSAKQAIFAFPSGLAAGDYHFTIAQHPWVSTDAGKTLTFTLTQAIPEDGQLVFNGAYNVTMVGTTISSYASPTSTTAIETVTMTEGGSGTDLGSLTNAGTPASNINSLQKALLGSNEWKTSAQRQYLNSDQVVGRVWTPQTIYDRPPTWATNTAGFMVGLDEDFLSCVGNTTYVTVRNTLSDGGGTDALTDKFYLPSRTEIFGSDEISGTHEGAQYTYYINSKSADRIKYHENIAVGWWLRTPNATNARHVRYVYTTGTLNSTSADGALGVVPACQIDLTKLSNPWLQNNMYKSRATTTPVYIGENQLDSVEGVADYVDKSSGKIVRMIGEYTFTGDESFNKYGNSDAFYTSKTIDPVGITTVNTTTMRCDHPAFTAIENKDTRYWLNPEADDICCFLPGGRSQVFFRSTSNFATATECKAYLKAQFDNGTPVKISYWLKTPVEEDPPVLLPDIPTIEGETIIDYDGTPKPSKMYVKYRR